MTLKKLGLAQRFRNHPTKKSEARRADKKVKTIAGRLVRELERNLPEDSPHHSLLAVCKKILAPKRGGSHKIYAIHEPAVQCISKGREHKKYEFENKVSMMVNNNGVIVGALSFRNEYDGHTSDKTIKQAIKLTGVEPKIVVGDRGYRRPKGGCDYPVLIPKPPSSKQTRYRTVKLKKNYPAKELA